MSEIAKGLARALTVPRPQALSAGEGSLSQKAVEAASTVSAGNALELRANSLWESQIEPAAVESSRAPVTQRVAAAGWRTLNATTQAASDLKTAVSSRFNRLRHGTSEFYDPVSNRYNAAHEVSEIKAAFTQDNNWSVLRKIADPDFIEDLHKQFKLAVPESADVHLVETLRSALRTLQKRDAKLSEALAKIDPDWMNSSAWAYEYPRHFDEWRKMLPLYEQQGVKVIEILPHLKHGGVDGGYDIVDHAAVAKEFGGNRAFQRFVNEAAERGIVVITDMVPNHVSDKHVQFKRLKRHDEAAAEWFVDMSNTKKIGTTMREEDGLPRLVLQHGDGKDAPVSTPWHVFDFASDDNLLNVTVNGKEKKFWHTFYPQQPDLNLEHPAAWRYIVDAMGWHSNRGVMGQRLDAVPHVAKKLGTDFEDIPETFAMEAALAAYWRLVQPKGVILPEVGKPFDAAAKHFGDARTVQGVTRNTQGDILFGFDLQAAYRASLLTADPEFLHAMNKELASLPDNSQFALWLGGHHDELRWDLIARQLKARGYGEEKIAAIKQGIEDAGGKDFAGRGYGIRHASMRNGDEHAIAADFVTAMGGTDAIPLMYEGDELALRNSQETMEKATRERGGVEDTRDLQREHRTAADIQAKRDEGAEPISVFSAMNALRQSHPAMRSKVNKLDAGESIYAVSRRPEQGEGVAVLRNLAAEPRTARIPLSTLEQQLGWSGVRPEKLQDILKAQMGGSSSVSARIENGQLALDLGPNDYAVLAGPGKEKISWS